MKEKLKKGLMIVAAVLTMGMLTAGNVIAADPIKGGWNDAKKSTGIGSSSTKDADDVVQTIITVLIWAVGILSTIMIIVGGIFYVTSAGDPGKIKKAKDTIMYGIIGLVIAVLAFAIVNFVVNSIL